ncbi:MAG TPA: DUF885 domain-containing protein [Steroidobacteraceae bacterium]|nr:DUF885 domain-containing protein [Steroidobacteraceae bacterium]
MKRTLKAVGWVALVLLLAGAYTGYRVLWGHPFTINQLANRQAAYFLLRNPEVLTSIGLIDGTFLDFHSGRLAPVGVEKRDSDYAFAEHALREVREFDRSRLKPQEQVTYDVLLDFYGSQVAFRRFDWLSSEGLYPVSPMFGTEVELANFMQSQHVVKNRKTAVNYVKRLQAMGGKLDALTAEMQRESAAGVVLPPALLEKSLTVIHDTIAPKPADNALVVSFVARMAKAQGLDPAERDRLRGEAVAALEGSVYPAYRRMAAALEAERAKAAGTAAGVGRLHDGVAFYQAMLHEFTTTDYTPEQVHNLGLAEVARITGEMDVLLRSQGRTLGTVAERMTELGKDPNFQFTNDEAGRRQALERYQKILDEVSARMPEYFRTVPPGQLKVVRVPPSSEKGSSGAYYQPAAMDGSRPGQFFANLRDMHEVPQWGMKTLAYHEGIPGHHFQIATAQGLKDMPVIRQQPIYTAYVEGWALYAERLAAEIGMYKDDPFGDLGRLQGEMLRAARLVVDTGLHAKGWTREQAIAYMVSTTGIAESDVTSEVERYMALPGQACAYKLGQLKILELREKARAKLGPKFALKDFHAVVLGNGAVPLTVLEQLVDGWIAGGGGPPAT